MSTKSFVVYGSLALSLLAACSNRPAPAMSVSHAGGAAVTAAPAPTTIAPAPAPIAPAPGSTTVAEIWKTRTSLAGKTVTVRGKVVKFNGGILGVNWIHIQDGTGQAADHTDDITVTSEADAKVGEEITVTGVVGLNKDIGSGYSYPVIIEHARIARP